MKASIEAGEFAIEEEAATWVARLRSSDATEGDRLGFDRWLANDPRNSAAYEEMSALWSDLAKVPRSVGRKRSGIKGTAAAFAVILSAGYICQQAGLIDRIRADYHTSIGEVSSFVLDDGSRITLNTDTALRVHFEKNLRSVELLRGEAFFDVSPDPDRPFTVTGHNGEATALGTHYSVRVGDGDDVMVEEGRVAVTSGQRKVFLPAGGIAHMSASGDLVSGTADVAGLTSWRDHKIIFSGRPLYQVIDELNRYQRGKIVVFGNATRDLKVSGVFSTIDIDQSIASIEDSLPVSITRFGGMLTIIRAR